MSSDGKYQLRFAVVPDQPWTDVKELNGTLIYDGYYKDFFHYLVSSINISHTLILPAITREDALQETFKLMKENKADISIGMFSANEERWKDVRFSVVFTSGYFSILSVPIGAVKEYSTSLLLIFSIHVWLLLFVVFLLTGFANWLMAISEPRVLNVEKRGRVTLWYHLYSLFGAFLGQGYTKLPVMNSARILTATWLFAVVILVSQVSSVLISVMAVIGKKDLVNEISDILKFPNIRPIISKGLVVSSYIQKADNPEYMKLWQQIQSHQGEIAACSMRSPDNLKQVLRESAVYISDIYDIYDFVSQTCQPGRHFYLSRGRFLDTLLVFILRKELDPYLVEAINLRILNYVGTGQLQKLFRDHYTKAAPCLLDSHSLMDSKVDQQKPLKMKDFHCVFRMLLFGIIFSCLCLCAELIKVWRVIPSLHCNSNPD